MERLNEIRINTSYASKLVSEYPDFDLKKESIPRKRRTNIRTGHLVGKINEYFHKDTVDISNRQLSPTNCRYFKQFDNGTVVVIEEPPAMRTIKVKMGMDEAYETLKANGQWKKFGYTNWFDQYPDRTIPYSFTLAIPYTIHLMMMKHGRFSYGSVFFRPKPLLGMADPLFKAPFLNISNGQSVCYGSQAHKGPGTSITAEIDHVIRVFWSAIFNPDYIDNYMEYQNVAGLCDYFTWQYYSHADPMFIYNADWIPCEQTLGQYVSDFENNSDLEREDRFEYSTLERLFDSPVVSDEKVEVEDSKTKRNIIYDISRMYIPVTQNPDMITLNIGDPIMYSKDRLAHIDSFIGVQGISHPRFVRMNLDGKLPILKLTEKVKSFLVEKTKEIRYETVLKIKDEEYRSGDIIIMKGLYGTEMYKKLYYIRKANDGKLEVRIGSQFWLVDTFDWKNVKKLDVTAPEINGIKIDKDTLYHFIPNRTYSRTPIAQTVEVKYDQMIVENNRLYGEFYDITHMSNKFTHDFSAQTSSSPKHIYDESEFEKIDSEVFSVGRNLLTLRNASDQHGNIPEPYILRHKNVGILHSNQLGRSLNMSLDTAFKELVKDDGKKFVVETEMNTIEFEVGDKVVVANWSNPLEMLKIKTITSFVKNEDTSSIEFALEDKYGKLENVPYVELTKYCINVGVIRKVVLELNKISIGTKIIAKEPRITCFPKKDVNIIIAFIIDTFGEPLVLCSNGCTLWLSDLVDKFELIPMKDKKWKNLQHAPLNPAKIKIQAGDTVNGTRIAQTNSGYLVVKSSSGAGLRFTNLDIYSEFPDFRTTSTTFLDNLVLTCIPNPRMTHSQQSIRGYVYGFPNFHGGIMQTNEYQSSYKFIDETGRF